MMTNLKLSKLVYCLLILFLVKTNLPAQQFVFPLYFEDNALNKDTVYIGYDTSATFYIDSLFAEQNIINQSINPGLDVRVTNETYCAYQPNCLLHTYHTKRQILPIDSVFNFYLQIAEIDVYTMNYPIRVSWDSAYFNQPFLNNLIITPWDPPGGWFDATTGCGSNSIITYLNYTTLQDFTNNDLCGFGFTDSGGTYTLQKFYIGWNYKTLNVAGDLWNRFVRVYPNPTENNLTMEGVREGNEVKVYDLSGREIVHNFEIIRGENLIKLSTETLEKGVYVLKVTSGSNFYAQMFVKH